MSDERWEPVPVPEGDIRHDIGDDARAAIVGRLVDQWRGDTEVSQEKLRQLAMWAAASVRALLFELGVLRDMGQASSERPRTPQEPVTSAATGRETELETEVARLSSSLRETEAALLTIMNTVNEELKSSEQSFSLQITRPLPDGSNISMGIRELTDAARRQGYLQAEKELKLRARAAHETPTADAARAASPQQKKGQL